jgi:hypothetical protein
LNFSLDFFTSIVDGIDPTIVVPDGSSSFEKDFSVPTQEKDEHGMKIVRIALIQTMTLIVAMNKRQPEKFTVEQGIDYKKFENYLKLT